MSITRTFEREVGNDGVLRYYEQPENGKEPAVGHLDLSEWAIRELGDPERIVVSIRRRGRGGDVTLGPHEVYDSVVRPT